MRLNLSSIFAVLLFELLATVSFAQSTGEPVVIGTRIEIYSTILKEKRGLLIATPVGYEQESDRYPVLYLLDGEDNFVHTVGITRFLANAGRIPPMLVVGIVNTNRTRDLTTLTKDETETRFHPEAGGADAFLGFISNELVPFIDKHYRTRPYNVLVGHSLGGLFAMHALVLQPKLFNAYIVIDPTLSWNDGAELRKAEEFLMGTKELKADLYITATGERNASLGAIQKLCGTLDQNTPKGFRWTFRQFSGETHISIPHRSIYAGLNKIFSYWHLADPLKLYDEGGMQAIHRHFELGNERYGYHRQTPSFTVSLVVAGLIAADRLDEAASVLLSDRQRYPPPWNQLDALARKYEQDGNTDQAVRFYGLALEENPKDSWAKKRLHELGATPTAAESRH